MKKFTVILVLYFSTLVCFSQSWMWNAQWQNVAAIDSAFYEHKEIQRSADGTLYVAQNLYFAYEDSARSCIYAFSSSGTQLWVKTYPFTINHFRVSPIGQLFIASNFSGSMMVGSILYNPGNENTDILLVRLDAGGEIINHRTLSTPSQEGAGGLCFENGDVLLTGYYSETLFIDGDSLPSNGSNNAFLLRLTPMFNLVDKFVTDCSHCSAGTVEAGSDGDIVFMSSISGLFYFTDSSLWGAGGVVMLKISSSFQPLWQHQISGGGPIYFDFKLDASSNILLHQIVHYTSSGYGNTLQKYDPNFNLLWERSRFAYPLSSSNLMIDYHVDELDNIYWCGGYREYYGPARKAYVGKFDPAGNVEWIMADTVDAAYPMLIAVKANDQFYVTGRYLDSTRFGPYSYTGHGDFVVFYGLDDVGISDHNPDDGLNAYPNPASRYFNLNSDGPAQLYLYSAGGQCVSQRAVFMGDNTIDCSTLASGIYEALLVPDDESAPRSFRMIITD
jgi:hypothetical protein